MAALIDLHGPPVRILEDYPATPWHLFMTAELQEALRVQLIGRGGQRLDVESKKDAAGGPPRRSTAHCVCGIDRHMHAGRLDGEMGWSFVVLFRFERQSQGPVELDGPLRLGGVQDHRCDLNHGADGARIGGRQSAA